MRQQLKWLPFPTATAAALAFFLPWFAVSCKSPLTQKEQKVAFSGYNFASGKMPDVVEGMLQVQQKLAGFGSMVMSLFKKKPKKPKKPLKPKKDPIKMLKAGFPSFWGAFGCFLFAGLLGLWFAIRGPTIGLRVAGTLVLLAGVACLLYPAYVNRPGEFKMPKQQIKMVSVQLEYGGYLLLTGFTAALFGFWAAPSPKPLPTLSSSSSAE